MHPMVYEKTKNGEALYDIYSRLVKDRILFLKDVIDVDEATTMCATLLFLDTQAPKNKEISIYINSVGGVVHSGLWTIYDTMQYIRAPIRTVCIGEAYSAASAVLMSGDKGRRMAFPNSRIMLHNVIGGMRGSSHKIEKEAELIKQTNETIVKLVIRHTGKSEQEVREAMKEETYFTAQQALEWGLIDKIVEPKSFAGEIKDAT